MEIEQSVCLNARMESVCDVCTCEHRYFNSQPHSAEYISSQIVDNTTLMYEHFALRRTPNT